MLKKYKAYLCILLTTVSLTVCSDQEEKSRQIKIQIAEVQQRLRQIEQHIESNNSDNQEYYYDFYARHPSYNGYGPELKGIKYNKTKSAEPVFHDSLFGIQFVVQLDSLLTGSLGEGKYAGGCFMTTYKQTNRYVYCETTPSFWIEMKKFLESKRGLFENRSHPNLISKNKIHFSNYNEAHTSIYQPSPRTITPNDLENNKRIINSIKDFSDILKETTLVCVTADKKNFQYTYDTYKSGLLFCLTGNNTLPMGAERSDGMRGGPDWPNLDKLPTGPDCQTRNNNHSYFVFSRGLWLQLSELLKDKDKRSNRPATEKSEQPNITSTHSKFSTLATPKNVALATLGIAALTTATYAALWYKGHGTSLPGMNTIFAPAFSKIATHAAPTLEKVGTFFGTQSVNISPKVTDSSLSQVPAALLTTASLHAVK